MDPGIFIWSTQTVVIDNEESATVPVTSGVPQGCVLGPILFLIYINDLPEHTRSKVRLFAVSSLEDTQILQQDLDHLHLWKLDWDMEFNPSKCVVIHTFVLQDLELQSQANTCCMAKYWDRLQAPIIWAWKSAVTYPSTATFRI